MRMSDFQEAHEYMLMQSKGKIINSTKEKSMGHNVIPLERVTIIRAMDDDDLLINFQQLKEAQDDGKDICITTKYRLRSEIKRRLDKDEMDPHYRGIAWSFVGTIGSGN